MTVVKNVAISSRCYFLVIKSSERSRKKELDQLNAHVRLFEMLEENVF